MTGIGAGALSLILLFGFASADVDVTPNDLLPGVDLEAKEWGDGSADPFPSGGGSVGPVVLPSEPQARCAFPDRINTDWDCGLWVPPGDPVESDAESDELSLAQVRRAVREVPMPALEVRVQPGERTLVNVPTIFYTEPRTLRESVDLLGHVVQVEATAVSFVWHHGDGSSQRSSDPGAAYPDESVTHAYGEVADRVSPRVDAVYAVRFRVDGGAWTPLGEDLTAPGPSTSLEVDEAAPVLVRP